VPVVFRSHLDMSLPWSRVALFILLINSNHSRSLSSTKSLLNEILYCSSLITSATVTCGSWAILKMVANWYLNGSWPIHVSYQNLIWVPSLIMKDPPDKTSSLIFIKPLPKWELYGLACNWVSTFEWRYLYIS
jgi:hypothetical protein